MAVKKVMRPATEYALMADGEFMCEPCVRENAFQILGNTVGDNDDPTGGWDKEWVVMKFYANEETMGLTCCHCNKPIATAQVETHQWVNDATEEFDKFMRGEG